MSNKFKQMSDTFNIFYQPAGGHLMVLVANPSADEFQEFDKLQKNEPLKLVR